MGNIGGSGSSRGIIIETGDKTIQAINNLNKSTTHLNKIMVWLTAVLVLLTGALVWLTLILIKR